MSIEARNRSLQQWFERIATRQLVLPRFQRFEAWGHANVVQLFNTILQDLPVGATLVLEVGNEEPFISRPLAGAPKTGERVTEHLLDGQQRLTALWRGLHNNYENRSFFISFTHDEETGLPYHVTSFARWQRPGDTEKRPFWANQPKEQWKRRLIPLDLFRPDLEALHQFQEWVKAAIEDVDEREQISTHVTVIRQKFFSFNLPFISLPVTTPREVALDVFIKMNTSAAPLSIYDIVVAQVEAGMGRSLHEMVAGLKEACPSISYYYEPENVVLFSGALLQGRPPTNSTYLDAGFGRNLMDNWELIVDGTKRAVEFLEQERIFDAQRLPSDVVVPVLVALWAMAPDGLDREGRTRVILRKYLWRAFFTSRYERSTNSRSLADFQNLRDYILDETAHVPTIFDDNVYPLPGVEELMTAGWPVRKERLARAILALALRHGGLDLADGSSVTWENLSRREYHHLFPVAYLHRAGITKDEEIYTALNCALITWRTNRNISDKEPERYLTERFVDLPDVTEEELIHRLSTHLIPYEEMVKGDYYAFIRARAEQVDSVCRELCG